MIRAQRRSFVLLSCSLAAMVACSASGPGSSSGRAGPEVARPVVVTASPPPGCEVQPAEAPACIRGIGIAKGTTCVWSQFAFTCWGAPVGDIADAAGFFRGTFNGGRIRTEAAQPCAPLDAACAIATTAMGLIPDVVDPLELPREPRLAHGCLREIDGSLFCTGNDAWARLGDGMLGGEYDPSPVAPKGLDTVLALAVGDTHRCAIKGDRSVWCWGAREGFPRAEIEVPPTRFVELRSNNEVWCARDTAGLLLCQPRGSLAMAPVRGLEEPVVAMADVGDSGLCALGASGAVGCLGDQLKWRPVLEGASGLVEGLACAYRPDGTVACWDGPAEVPDGFTPLGSAKVSHVIPVPEADEATACALTPEGVVLCWGPIGMTWRYHDEPNPRAFLPHWTYEIQSSGTAIPIPNGGDVLEMNDSGCVRKRDGTLAKIRRECPGVVCKVAVSAPPGGPKVEALVPGACRGRRADGSIVGLEAVVGMYGPGTPTAPLAVVEGAALDGAVADVLYEGETLGIGRYWNTNCAFPSKGGLVCRKYAKDAPQATFDPRAAVAITPQRIRFLLPQPPRPR